MKKLFMFLSVAALAVTMACSSDDDSNSSQPGGEVTVTINGVAKTFDNVIVNETTYPAEGNYPAYTSLFVTATVGSSASEVITFDVEQGDVGANMIHSFTYTMGGQTYYNYNELSSVVQTNTADGNLTGSFTGQLMSMNGESTLNLTGGSFSIRY